MFTGFRVYRVYRAYTGSGLWGLGFIVPLIRYNMGYMGILL